MELTHCLYCGSTQGVVFVHGHYQCANCGQVIIPCCNGEHGKYISTPGTKKNFKAQTP